VSTNSREDPDARHLWYNCVCEHESWAPQLRRSPLGAPHASMPSWRDFGLPVRSSSTLWKKDPSVDVERIVSTFEAELRRVRAEPERTEDGLRAIVPLQLWVRPLREWRTRLPFASVNQVELEVRQTDRAFRVIVTGRSSVLIPLLAALFGYVLVAQPPQLPGFVASLLGVVWALFYWGGAWFLLNADVSTMKKCAPAVQAGGRPTSA
jgi:hypothetical protein